ncbi:MAG: ABC-2 family transporter protein [Anaerolineae bacterium]
MPEALASLRKYWWVGYTAARSNLAYLTEVATRTLFLVLILFIFLQLWRVTYQAEGSERLAGLTLTEMLWYLAVTEAITISTVNVGAEVDSDVRTGALAVQLIRPLSYPLYRLCLMLGERFVRFAINISVALLIALLLAGGITLSPSGVLMCIVVLPLAFTLDFFGEFVIGLLAFWLEDTSGLRLIYRRLTMILGGMLFPLPLFPDWAQPILNALPFASVVYAPARLLIRPDAQFFVETLAKQFTFVVLYAAITFLLFRVAVRKVNNNGG